ncbi:pseudoazurin [Jannaschia formosa]|uniref:pseudoazurin n=1 Tax=Jannaschia formosa TaxID=2259592 RepID=UPI000E1BE6EF|nr:pseudoazurin [Jannaschia formosa]TFL17268.1 pseudoazurin [Jannaschia formosa]
MASAAALALMMSSAAFAETYEVKMLNVGSDGERMVFEPSFLKVEPGDTVTFLPTDKSHNAESILGMMPEGAEAFKGRINQEISVTFDEAGVYGIKCLPHFALGMIALIQVGDDLPNLDQAMQVRAPGQAAARMAVLLDQVAQGDAAEGGDAEEDASN